MEMLQELRNPNKLTFNCVACLNGIDSGYQCIECKNFTLCELCFTRYGHPHQTEKLVIKVKEESYAEKWIRRNENLKHAAGCLDITCKQLNCQKIKQTMHHYRLCRMAVKLDCQVCKKFIALSMYHARRCFESNCMVPNCLRQRFSLSNLNMTYKQMMGRRPRPATVTNTPMRWHAIQGTPGVTYGEYYGRFNPQKHPLVRQMGTISTQRHVTAFCAGQQSVLNRPLKQTSVKLEVVKQEDQPNFAENQIKLDLPENRQKPNLPGIKEQLDEQIIQKVLSDFQLLQVELGMGQLSVDANRQNRDASVGNAMRAMNNPAFMRAARHRQQMNSNPQFQGWCHPKFTQSFLDGDNSVEQNPLQKSASVRNNPYKLLSRLRPRDFKRQMENIKTEK